MLVELFLVGDAGCLVVDDDLRLETSGSTLAGSAGDVGRDLGDPRRCLDEDLDRGGLPRQRDLIASDSRSSTASSSKAASIASWSMWSFERRGSKCNGRVAPSRIESWKE